MLSLGFGFDLEEAIQDNKTALIWSYPVRLDDMRSDEVR